ncbi:MAG: hypothetical protein NZ898_02940 [Myxococcota bacterium]|nr:hypothetical protein [Myxococcota bacterium]MDW8360980.1 hypothetical protein [Myxococcales bacterium]
MWAALRVARAVLLASLQVSCSALTAVDEEAFRADASAAHGRMDAGGSDTGTPRPDADAPSRDGSRPEAGARDTGPPPECTAVGLRETIPCGRCGLQVRTCVAPGRWSYEPCAGEGECHPGDSRETSCGRVGRLEQRCSESCRWPRASCPLDVMVLIDVTATHSPIVARNRGRIRDELVRPLLESGDVRVGLAVYSDFSPAGGWISPGTTDVPFQGVVAPTNVREQIESALEVLPATHGGDLPDSGVEALATLAGLDPHPTAKPFDCREGLDRGGCWRPDAERAVVILTDAASHEGPTADGRGVHAPYPPFLGAATWARTRDALQAGRIALYAVARDSGPIAEDARRQLERMCADLGQEPRTSVAFYTEATPDLRVALRTVREWIVARYGLTP